MERVGGRENVMKVFKSQTSKKTKESVKENNKADDALNWVGQQRKGG